MAKNKNNKYSGQMKNRNSAGASAKNTTNSNMKDSHAQVPDNSPNRSGPGGN